MGYPVVHNNGLTLNIKYPIREHWRRYYCRKLLFSPVVTITHKRSAWLINCAIDVARALGNLFAKIVLQHHSLRALAAFNQLKERLNRIRTPTIGSWDSGWVRRSRRAHNAWTEYRRLFGLFWDFSAGSMVNKHKNRKSEASNINFVKTVNCKCITIGLIKSWRMLLLAAERPMNLTFLYYHIFVWENILWY